MEVVHNSSYIDVSRTDPNARLVFNYSNSPNQVKTSRTDPNARLVFNYSNSPDQVNVPVTGTNTSNFAPGTIAASTLNRYTVSPPTGNV